MSTDLLARPETRTEEIVDDALCIFCHCRPLVSYCGVYAEGPIDDDGWGDDEVCPDCLQVWETTGCPGCGCVRDARCRVCRPRWWQS